MKNETSYGVIPVMYKDQIPYLLLIQHHSGFWGFPKGHKEKDETDLEAASRELKEETRLDLMKLLYDEPFVENYRFRHKGQPISKKVLYYLALVDGDLFVQVEEVKDAKWVPVTQAESFATYSEGKALVRKVIQFL